MILQAFEGRFQCELVFSTYILIVRFVLVVDNEEELFNPNCVTVNLLDNLRRRCGCQKGSRLPQAIFIYIRPCNSLFETLIH